MASRLPLRKGAWQSSFWCGLRASEAGLYWCQVARINWFVLGTMRHGADSDIFLSYIYLSFWSLKELWIKQIRICKRRWWFWGQSNKGGNNKWDSVLINMWFCLQKDWSKQLGTFFALPHTTLNNGLPQHPEDEISLCFPLLWRMLWQSKQAVSLSRAPKEWV